MLRAKQANDSLGESDMNMDINEDDSVTLYDGTSLPPFDLGQESEEIRCNSPLYLWKRKDRDKASQAAIQ